MMWGMKTHCGWGWAGEASLKRCEPVLRPKDRDEHPCQSSPQDSRAPNSPSLSWTKSGDAKDKVSVAGDRRACGGDMRCG